MHRAYYRDSIEEFLIMNPETILGCLVNSSQFSVEQTQRDAWRAQIEILKSALVDYKGSICFEYAIPRMGERIDVLLLIGAVVFVLEFKVGKSTFDAHALEQVFDYALDLKNFHEPSHNVSIVPILVATEASRDYICGELNKHHDGIFSPVKSSVKSLSIVIESILKLNNGSPIDPVLWENGRYCPTPTIIEAATALYRSHDVKEISRNDARAKNLSRTTEAISAIISKSKETSSKAICFVTGVPGAGKTLIGLNIATKHLDTKNEMYSVFLSGNGPLVKILQEALVRDRVRRARENNERLTKEEASSEVKAFIQNVHHYRDEYLKDSNPPVDHVALFDEAQRAWDLEQTVSFMKRKKGYPNFKQSEPEFLISCIDRHKDWGTIVCLVGGGQEINTGEAGIGEWLDALNRSFPSWHIHISNRLTDSEYAAGLCLERLKGRSHVFYSDDLHHSASMRTFRAENVSLLVKQILDLDLPAAQETLEQLKTKYPIVITRDLGLAKQWLKAKARGSERFGMVVSSSAERLRPLAVNVKSPMNPVHWFLAGKNDVRSSYYLEDVATEFSVQGLELDWTCVTWDGDFRFTPHGWKHYAFVGKKWNRVCKPARQTFLKNAYRVLLTRARQGMVIVIPYGDPNDPTRASEFYDPTFDYLRRVGFPVLS